jgi:hypothetical protein
MKYPISTITALAVINTEVDIPSLFWMCPLDYLTHLRINEVKIEYPGRAGLVIGAKYENYTRGTIKSDKESFNHAITFLVSTEIKNVTLRFTRTNFHISGAKSLQDAENAVNILVERFQDLYNLQNKIINMPIPVKQQILNEICYYSRGHYVYNSETNEKYISTQYRAEWSEYNDYADVCKYLASFVYDYERHDNFCKFITSIMNLSYQVVAMVQVIELQSSMINIDYNIGFKVDRNALYKYLNGKHMFDVILYKKGNIGMYLPYERPDSFLSKKKNKQSRHTFTVTPQGCVKQSSPNIELAEQAHDYFLEHITNIREYIENKDELDLVVD